MSAHEKPPVHTPQPVVDEWGIYDPDQAGLAAVLERLDSKRPPTPTSQNAMSNSPAATGRTVARLRSEV